MATEPWLEVAFEGKGQQNESCRLLLFREKPRLQNLSAGELLDLEVGSELHEARSCLVMRSQGEEDPADVKEFFLKDVFEMSLGMDDSGETVLLAKGQTAMKYETLKSSRDTVALKLHLRTDRQMSWRAECYLFHVPQCSQPVSSVRFLLRWMVDALGGSKHSNEIGRRASSWRNLTARYLAETRVADAAAESELHLTTSSWSSLMSASRNEASSRMQGGNVEQSEYHCSPFCLLSLLVKFAVEDNPKNSSWNLPGSMVKTQAAAILKALIGHFAEANLQRAADDEQHAADFQIAWRKVEGDVMLDWQSLSQSEKTLQNMFPGAPQEIELSKLLLKLRADDVGRGVSPERKNVCRELRAFLFMVLSDCMEATLRTDVWQETRVEQLQQLRSPVVAAGAYMSLFIFDELG